MEAKEQAQKIFQTKAAEALDQIHEMIGDWDAEHGSKFGKEVFLEGLKSSAQQIGLFKVLLASLGVSEKEIHDTIKAGVGEMEQETNKILAYNEMFCTSKNQGG